MIFISYSKDDIRWKGIIEKKLKVITRQKGLNADRVFWHDGHIRGGNPDWMATLDLARRKSKSVIFLYSENFVASDFIEQEEYHYFLKRRDEVDIYWFVLDKVIYANSELYRYNIQACVPPSGRITPLVDMTETALQDFLFKSLNEIVTNDIQRHDGLFSDLSANRPGLGRHDMDYIIDNRAYGCNRSKETEIFDHCYYTYANTTNTLCFAIDGDKDDLLDSMSQTLWLKSIKALNKSSRKEPNIIMLDKIIDCLPNNGMPQREFIKTSLRIKLLKQLNLPLKPHLPVNRDYIADSFKGSSFAILQFNVKSTYFHEAVYDSIFDWLHNEFLRGNNPVSDLTLLVLFAFEKNGSEPENQYMIDYLDKKVHYTNFYNILYHAASDIPGTINNTDLIYLGSHKQVSQNDIKSWLQDNTYIDRIHFDQLFDLANLKTVKMKEVVSMINKFIRKHNQFLLNQ